IAQFMTKRTRLSVLLISTPLVAFIVLGTVRSRAADGDDTFQHLRVFEDVVSLILNNYVEDPKVDNVMEGAMRGLADSLDPDSAAPAQVRAQAADLLKNGAKRLIVDIRRTAEGSFDNGIETARLFVKSGTIVQIAGRDPQAKPADKPAAKVLPATITQTIAAKAGDGAVDVPVTLLVTTGTSGAAELFAAALSGNKRADLVGERTLGRAGLQKLVKLPD